MFDVGGQREERRKWIHVFDGIEALLFVLSCSDFDQKLREDGLTNRFSEAIELFQRVWHNGMLTGAGIIVFLNKQDLLEKKIRNGQSLEKFFPEYNQFYPSKMTTSDAPRRPTVKNDPLQMEIEKSRQFIKNKLVQVTHEPPRRMSNRSAKVTRDCYFHFTTATDSENIRRVFGDVHDMILQKLLARVDLI